jgi:rhodanese-related sulfurtransferase
MKKVYFFILLFVGMSSLAAGAEKQPLWKEKPAGKMIEAALKSIKQVPVADLKKLMDEGEDFVLLDVRTPREYEAAHIPEAISASRGLLEFSIWYHVPDLNEPIYVYCKSGGRSALATKLLNDFGYKNAVSVATGIAGWAKSGYPVQTSITDDELILIRSEE